MRTLGLALFVCVLAFGGCYESTHELYPYSGGVRLNLAEGEYQCIGWDGKERTGHVSVAKGSGTTVRYEVRTKQDEAPESVAFHHIGGDRYIGTHLRKTLIRRRDVQLYVLVRFAGQKLEWFSISKDLEKSLAQELGGANSFGELFDSSESQRKFLEAAGQSEPERIGVVCEPKK